MRRYAAVVILVATGACGEEANVEFDVGLQEREVVRSPLAVPEQYIVVLNDEVRALATDATVDGLVSTHGGRVLQRYRTALRGFAVRTSDAVARRLARHPLVKRVEEDSLVSAIATQSPVIWNLDRIDQRPRTRDNSFTYDATGDGVHAYVIDTGIRASHDEFVGRVGAGTDVYDNDSNPDDCHGHGTHVAGTLGGTTYGVAKDVTLHAVRVLGCDATGTLSQVVAGVDWVTTNAALPAVANMSLGGAASDTMDDAVRASIAAGISYALAAGNSEADACNGSPGRVAEALTVGATESSDRKWRYSNQGPCVDIFAPGVSITSAYYDADNATRTWKGTSMASPHVAGVMAAYLEDNPSSSPADAFGAVIAVATDNCIQYAGVGSPNLLLHNRLDATDPAPHCSGVRDVEYDPNSCWESDSCGSRAPGGCWCDSMCARFGDCCYDAPCDTW